MIFRGAVAAFALLLLFAAHARAQNEAAILLEIRGTASLDAGGSTETMGPEWQGFILHVGETVRCIDDDCLLKLKLANRPGLKTLKRANGDFTIPTPPPSPQSRDQQALNRFSHRGGPDRPAPNAIYSPAPDGAASVATLEVLWTPLADAHTVTVEIRPEGGQGPPTWRADGVDARAGRLDAQAARQALKEFRDGGGVGRLQLTLTDERGNAQSVGFTLLTAGEERALADELARWNGENGSDSLMRYIGRAYSFNRLGLFPEAAREYDAALALAPRSTALLEAAVLANARIGNTAREEALKKELDGARKSRQEGQRPPPKPSPQGTPPRRP